MRIAAELGLSFKGWASGPQTSSGLNASERGAWLRRKRGSHDEHRRPGHHRPRLPQHNLYSDPAWAALTRQETLVGPVGKEVRATWVSGRRRRSEVLAAGRVSLGKDVSEATHAAQQSPAG